VPNTCGQCHHGIEEQFEKRIHSKDQRIQQAASKSAMIAHAHSIHRTDENTFRLNVMTTMRTLSRKDCRDLF